MIVVTALDQMPMPYTLHVLSVCPLAISNEVDSVTPSVTHRWGNKLREVKYF